MALDFYLDSFHKSLIEADAGSVEVTVDGDGWTVGGGDVVAGWVTNRYEALRGWTGDVDRIAGLVSRYGLPASGLVEL